MRAISPVLIAFISGCATVSDKAATVQVHSQVSNLLNDCERLGPVVGKSSNLLSDLREPEALNQIREATADIGGDSVAIVNLDSSHFELAVHGVALKCY